MTDIGERLEQRAASYEQSGPSAHHTAALLREAKAEIERLQAREHLLRAVNAAIADQAGNFDNEPILKHLCEVLAENNNLRRKLMAVRGDRQERFDR